MDYISAFLNSQPFIALFLVIGLGYAAGRVCIGGFSLGSGAVLFVGLAVGAIAPKAAPPGLLGTIGLVVFLYGMGIQYGKDFFRGLASPFGIKANILGAVAVLGGCAVAFGTARIMGFGMDFAAGMFAGTMTSTASLQAALDASGNANPATGYAIAYPFGVLGPILCFFLAGVCVLLTTVLIVLLVGYFVLQMNFDELLGVASGTTGNPAILAYANQSAPTDRVNLSYAMIFPGVGTIVKVIAVQVMVALGAGGDPPG